MAGGRHTGLFFLNTRLYILATVSVELRASKAERRKALWSPEESVKSRQLHIEKSKMLKVFTF